MLWPLLHPVVDLITTVSSGYFNLTSPASPILVGSFNDGEIHPIVGGVVRRLDPFNVMPQDHRNGSNTVQ